MNILITGAGSEIGKEFVKQYKKNNNVFAYTHKQFDIVKDRLPSKLVPLDLIIHIAAIHDNDFVKSFRTNAVAPYKLTLKLDELGKFNWMAKIVFISSIAGSISCRGQMVHHTRTGIELAYKVSKAALNCFVKNLAYEWGASSRTILCISPGFCKTKNPTTKNATLSVKDSVAGMIRIIRLSLSRHSGQFFNYDGTIIPW